ncbi:MAG: hypothetical protein ACFFKA_16615 [Candidatus Thorarchaeota archaeon]
MKIISIDLSSNSGVAYFDSKQPGVLVNCFDYQINKKTPISETRAKKLTPDQLSSERARKRALKKKRTIERYDPSNHPVDFIEFVDNYIQGLVQELIDRGWLDQLYYIVIEQTNKGRDRWKQKLLEWLHYKLCTSILFRGKITWKQNLKIAYIDTMEWRKILEIKVSTTQRRANKKIRKHNKEAKNNPELKRMIGITKNKDVAIEFCENKFNLCMNKKDNNIADAICVGYAWLKKQGEVDVKID